MDLRQGALTPDRRLLTCVGLGASALKDAESRCNECRIRVRRGEEPIERRPIFRVGVFRCVENGERLLVARQV